MIPDKEVQIEALKLGYSQPKVLKPLPTLRAILEEQSLSITYTSANKYLLKNKHLLKKEEYEYWKKISKKLKK